MKRNGIVALVTLSALLVTSVLVPGGLTRTGNASTTPNTGDAALNNTVQQTSAIDQRQLVGAKLGLEASSNQAGAISKREISPASGEPRIMQSGVPFSAALAMTVGGRNTHFNNVSVLGDFDGREDLAADREGIERDLSGAVLPNDFSLTRVAISEHTIANGFNENIFYYGDSVGNLYVDATPLTNISTPTPTANRFSINLPTALNAFGTLNSDSQIVITGIGVCPVSDLSSFANVNGAYASYNGLIGEIVYVSYTDTGGGLRLSANNTLVRSGVLAYPVADIVSAAPAAPAIASPAGFPIQMGNAFGVAFSIFSNLAGVAVDDDGSVYFQQVDLVGFTGGNIVKIQDIGSNQDRSLATNGFLTINNLNPVNGLYPNASGPASQVNRFTNYSGTNTFFGNIAAIAAGPGNALYAAVTRSFEPTDDVATQNTEGLFTNPAALGATPAMIITFTDVIGGFDVCSTLTTVNGNPFNVPVAGLPVGNGIADSLPGSAVTWRAYVQGSGPDRRTDTAPLSSVFGATANTQKVDFQVDFSIYSGLTVDEGGRLYLISGGTPSGVGLNPSARIGEVLCFEDTCPTDRRADYTDLRGATTLPNPPDSGANTGDGADTRTDHIFWQSPIDIVTATPTGIAGLARGFLRYLNRTAPNVITNLPNGTVQGDDATSGEITFESFDPSHQVAGGDDQNTPFRGDNNDGAGTTPLVGPLSGGFEFTFGGTPGTSWNGFFLNSNGSVSFGVGDTDNTPAVTDFRSGPPKIAGAWTDLNSSSRLGGFLKTFPVQAVGFAGINQFKVRWIGVPEFGNEVCSSSNTFSISLFDDGTGIDENANQPLDPANPIGNNAVPFDLREGPTDFRWVREPNTGTLVPNSFRREGSGNFVFDYGRMDLLGTSVQPVITGYSVGGMSLTNPPGLCEANLGDAASAAEGGQFGIIQSQTDSIETCLLGEGTEPTVYEIFESGKRASVGSQGEIFEVFPDFDLRFPGNNPAASKPAHQNDQSHGTVGFFGIGPAAPTAPTISQIVPGPFVTTPTTRGLINVLGGVELNLVGTGFLPNETTTVCSSGVPSGDIPTPRPGKTVSSAVTFAVDTNGDGIPEAVVALTNVTVVNRNLVRGTLAPLPAFPGTPFPLAACGGLGTATLTTSFTVGDNNLFGAFTRTAAGTFQTDRRAPVVLGVTPSEGDCSLQQDVIIGGSCFILPPPAGGITEVFAVEDGNPSNIVQATTINTLDINTVVARFNIGALNVGKTFRIFITGPNFPAPAGPTPTPSPSPGYTSRNLSTLPAGTPPGVPLGNEAGNLVKFTCLDVAPPTITCPANISVNVPAGQTSAVVNYPNPVVTDNQPGATSSCNIPSGSAFSLGTTVVTCTATDTSGNTSACSFNVGVFGPNFVHLSSSNYSVTEGCASATITVQRENPTGASPVTVDVATSDGSAVQKSDYEIAATTLTFNAGETTKTVTVLVNEDTYLEGDETVNITLSNPQGGTLTGPVVATLTINDNDVLPPTSNAIDSTGTFVCEHYHDFLNREPDAAGAAFWADQITSCGVDPACIEVKRINVSAAFFLSIEFQETGGDVLRVQRAAFGRRSNDPLTRVTYQQFMREAQQVGQGVIVGQPGFQAVLDANKAAYVTQIVNSSAFIVLHPLAQTAGTYVDGLFTSAGVVPTTAERDAAIAAFGGGGTAGRAAALQSVASSNSLRQAEFNAAFVLMQYYGYLRRNPTDPPDNNDVGYQFWLTKLNAFGGNFVNAEMVKAFLNSSEYRQRFGP